MQVAIVTSCSGVDKQGIDTPQSYVHKLFL